MSLVAALASIVPAAPPPIAYWKAKSGAATYHIVQANLASGRLYVRTVVASGLIAPWEFVKQTQPQAAITGTFFAPSDGTPIADVLVNGKMAAQGNRGSGFGVDYFGKVRIFDESHLRAADWTGYRYGLRGAVRLVAKSKVVPNPPAQGFKDARIWGRASRTGLGVNQAGKVVFMATSGSVTLSEFGNAMVAQGVVDGLSLDGGSSSCLYFRGRMLMSPVRKLSNMVLISG